MRGLMTTVSNCADDALPGCNLYVAGFCALMQLPLRRTLMGQCCYPAFLLMSGMSISDCVWASYCLCFPGKAHQRNLVAVCNATDAGQRDAAD